MSVIKLPVGGIEIDLLDAGGTIKSQLKEISDTISLVDDYFSFVDSGNGKEILLTDEMKKHKILKRQITALLWNTAIDALESLILAHAVTGVDVQSSAYIEGIETALDAVKNHL